MFLGLLLSFCMVFSAETSIKDLIPKGVGSYEIVDVRHVSYHRMKGADHTHLSFAFHAFQNTYHLHLKPCENFLTNYGNYGLPYLVLNADTTKQDMINFKQMNVTFYEDVSHNGAFSVGVNHYPPSVNYEINGIIQGVTEDIVIQSIKRKTRMLQINEDHTKHLVFKRPKVNIHSICDDTRVVNDRAPRVPSGFFTDVFNPAAAAELGEIHMDKVGMQPNMFDDSSDTVSTGVSGSENVNNLLSQMKSILQVSTTAGSVNGTVEVLVYTDLSFYQSFTNLVGAGNEEQEILKYIAVVVHAGNLRYKYGIRDSTLKISLVLSGVVICKNESCSGFTERNKVNGTVNNYRALDDFAIELKTTKHLTKLNFKYDYAVAFTRLDLTDPHGTPLGVSFTNKICSIDDGKSSSVVEDQGGYSSIGTFVHELGHTLGSDHDGWFRSRPCLAMDGYIMSSLSPLTKNGFFFSQCSINSIKSNLQTQNASCIYDKAVVNSTLQSLGNQMPGQIYNRTAQCQQIYGTDFCLSVGTTLADICYKMFCWDPVLPLVCSTKSPAALGTSCGIHKWCVRGDCVYDSNAPE